jgi:DNA-binding transcriptional LysR family regulator
VTGLGWQPFFDALGTLHAEHPGIDLRLHEGDSSRLVAEVSEGTADVAVAAWSGARPEGVRSAVVVDDPLVVVVADGHPWRARRSIRSEEIARADLITLPRGTGARSALDGLLARADAAEVEPRWEVSSPAFVRMLAARGLGVGLVSETTAGAWDDVTVIPVADVRARSQFGLVWRPRPSHASRALLELLLPEATP